MQSLQFKMFYSLFLILLLVAFGDNSNYYSDFTADRDERELKPCGEKQFKCISGKCIPDFECCDGRDDCYDDSDEQSFVCLFLGKSPSFGPHHDDLSVPFIPVSSLGQNSPPVAASGCYDGSFSCSNGDCIPENQACNGIEDCSDGSDERFCNCRRNEFDCGVGHPRCIPDRLVCDHFAHCFDDRDEVGCEEDPTCPLNKFKCNNNFCIDLALVCDNYPDCGDDTDEGFWCPKTEQVKMECPSHTFDCKTKDLCVSNGLVCNGYNDCGDGSDEGPQCRGRICKPWEKRCDSGQCIQGNKWCDDMTDCSDYSDEMSCTAVSAPEVAKATPPPLKGRPMVAFKCRLDQLKCSLEEKCVSYDVVCDGIKDCKYANDESGFCKVSHKVELAKVVQGCSVDEYRCEDHSGCIPVHKLCDHMPDCLDHSDEGHMCDKGPHADSPACNEEDFRCRSSGVCIHRLQICNTINDCGDNSDESMFICQDKATPGICAGFQCNDGTCLHVGKRCDCSKDCPDGSDEGSFCYPPANPIIPKPPQHSPLPPPRSPPYHSPAHSPAHSPPQYSPPQQPLPLYGPPAIHVGENQVLHNKPKVHQADASYGSSINANQHINIGKVVNHVYGGKPQARPPPHDQPTHHHPGNVAIANSNSQNRAQQDVHIQGAFAHPGPLSHHPAASPPQHSHHNLPSQNDQHGQVNINIPKGAKNVAVSNANSNNQAQQSVHAGSDGYGTHGRPVQSVHPGNYGYHQPDNAPEAPQHGHQSSNMNLNLPHGAGNVAVANSNSHSSTQQSVSLHGGRYPQSHGYHLSKRAECSYWV